MARPAFRSVNAPLGLAIAAVVGVVALVMAGNGGSSGPRITAILPETWTDRATTSAEDADGFEVIRLEAAPDLDAFRARLDAAGVEIAYTDTPDVSEIERLLAEVEGAADVAGQCDGPTDRPVSIVGFAGRERLYTGCGADGGSVWLLALVGVDRPGHLTTRLHGTADEQGDLLSTLGVAG